jgi:hypothetical protein
MSTTEINPVKPKRRWFQYRLKSLFVLTLVVGLALAFYLYWDDWQKQRPPHKKYDSNEYLAACNDFFDDLKAGRLDHAYEATSTRFKKRMSRIEFETTVGRFLALRNGPKLDGVVAQASILANAHRYVLDRNGCYRSDAVDGPDNKVTELCVWVLTDVADDSFLYRRPPPPRVEEIQVREFSEAEWKSEKLPDPKPSWDHEPTP